MGLLANMKPLKRDARQSALKFQQRRLDILRPIVRRERSGRAWSGRPNRCRSGSNRAFVRSRQCPALFVEATLWTCPQNWDKQL